jgi:hypothetical protein
MMASPLGRSPTAQSPLSRDYVYNVDSNKLWIPGKKFGPLTYYYGDIMLLHRDEQFQCKYWRTVTYLSSVTPLQHWLHWHRHYEFSEIVGAIYTEYICRAEVTLFVEVGINELFKDYSEKLNIILRVWISVSYGYYRHQRLTQPKP